MAEVLIERVPQGKIWDWLLSDKPLALHKSIELVSFGPRFCMVAPDASQVQGTKQHVSCLSRMGGSSSPFFLLDRF
ncbi:MAG: hypothetical protein HY019_18655 [Aquabacterium sp.]|uniref:hypothetical protein n=1 Tax=Aquabacterium sp. TaxID=1872578 RepID=UPI0025C69C3E|nr:hypothetical protein [Aquabacterium sp.]MBI3384027.1 hypothetical protein [Aquabacterium sp.]